MSLALRQSDITGLSLRKSVKRNMYIHFTVLPYFETFMIRTVPDTLIHIQGYICQLSLQPVFAVYVMKTSPLAGLGSIESL